MGKWYKRSLIISILIIQTVKSWLSIQCKIYIKIRVITLSMGSISNTKLNLGVMWLWRLTGLKEMHFKWRNNDYSLNPWELYSIWELNARYKPSPYTCTHIHTHAIFICTPILQIMSGKYNHPQAHELHVKYSLTQAKEFIVEKQENCNNRNRNQTKDSI